LSNNTMTTLSIGLMLSMLAIAGLFAGGISSMVPIAAVYADDEESTEVDTEIENEAQAKADAENEDNDVVVQSNDADVAQIADNRCDAGAAVSDDDVVGVTGANVAVAANDCENTSTQTSNIGQANVNDDRDVQLAIADAEAEADQTICGQLAFLGLQLCDNEVEEED
jgi:hypothetical protein